MSRSLGAPAAALLLNTFAVTAALAQNPLPAATARPAAEDCVPLDPAATPVAETGDWKLAAGSSAALDFGQNGQDAKRAADVIQHYHFTWECFVRRPLAHMMYFKNGVAVPPGNMQGQDCIKLDPHAAEVAYVAGGWKVVDGQNWLLDYGADRTAAQQSVAIIRNYSLNRECFIARPHVLMQYWLSE
ncbi:MAG TPA: hypothetical protein VN154_09640 [Rhizomicrobium sp.]|nr:hypothetical protein [Rhizomicrobium sp.]